MNLIFKAVAFLFGQIWGLISFFWDLFCELFWAAICVIITLAASVQFWLAVIAITLIF